MTTTGGPAIDTEPARARLDRPLLVSNLVSGAIWLLLLAPFAGPLLVLIGAVYVVSVSAFLAAVYSRRLATWGQEARAWITP